MFPEELGKLRGIKGDIKGGIKGDMKGDFKRAEVSLSRHSKHKKD